MNFETPNDRRKARRVSLPLPHPSWRPGAPAVRADAKKELTADEFWERLGL